MDRESARVRDAFLASVSPPAPGRARWGILVAWLVVVSFALSVLLGVWWVLVALGVIWGWWG